MCTDIEFTDVVDKYVPAQSFKLYPDGRLYWSRHVVLKVLQPNLDLHDYPLDSHDIILKFGSYSHSVSVLTIAFKAPAVNYVVDTDDDLIFEKNPIWHHHHVRNEFDLTILK